MNHHAQSIIDPNRFQQFLPDLAIAIDDVAGLAGQQSDKLGRSIDRSKLDASIEANWTLDAIEGK
jgi:hypothetical protein